MDYNRNIANAFFKAEYIDAWRRGYKKKQKIIIAICLLAQVGCNERFSNSSIIGETVVQNQRMGSYRVEHVAVFKNDTIPFFGESLILDDSAHVMQQIKEIAEKDTMLSVDGRVLTIGDVGFGINVHGNGVTLISSVQINDPKITPIVLYLTSLYGNPTETGSEEGYYWLDEGIRLRQLHSEDGGTTIIFQGINGVEKSNNE